MENSLLLPHSSLAPVVSVPPPFIPSALLQPDLKGKLKYSLALRDSDLLAYLYICIFLIASGLPYNKMHFGDSLMCRRIGKVIGFQKWMDSQCISCLRYLLRTYNRVLSGVNKNYCISTHEFTLSPRLGLIVSFLLEEKAHIVKCTLAIFYYPGLIHYFAS